MPFTITDDALDALDASPEPERLKFLEGLSDDERTQLGAAVPTWRAKRAAPAAAPAPMVKAAAPAPPAEAPDFWDQAARLGHDALTSMQMGSAINSGLPQAMGGTNETLGDMAKGFVMNPGQLNASALPMLPARIAAAYQRSRGQEVSPSVKEGALLGARATQGMNPFLGGEFGSNIIEGSNYGQQGALELERNTADVVGEKHAAQAAGVVQAGAQAVPQILDAAGGLALRGVEAAPKALPLVQRLLRIARSAPKSVAIGSAYMLAGAEEGHRGEAAIEGGIIGGGLHTGLGVVSEAVSGAGRAWSSLKNILGVRQELHSIVDTIPPEVLSHAITEHVTTPPIEGEMATQNAPEVSDTHMSSGGQLPPQSSFEKTPAARRKTGPGTDALRYQEYAAAKESVDKSVARNALGGQPSVPAPDMTPSTQAPLVPLQQALKNVPVFQEGGTVPSQERWERDFLKTEIDNELLAHVNKEMAESLNPSTGAKEGSPEVVISGGDQDTGAARPRAKARVAELSNPKTPAPKTSESATKGQGEAVVHEGPKEIGFLHSNSNEPTGGGRGDMQVRDASSAKRMAGGEVAKTSTPAPSRPSVDIRTPKPEAAPFLSKALEPVLGAPEGSMAADSPPANKPPGIRLASLAPNAGEPVYVGKARGTRTTAGVFLGMDAENPGHVIVFVPPGSEAPAPRAVETAERASEFLKANAPNKAAREAVAPPPDRNLFKQSSNEGSFVSLPAAEVFPTRPPNAPKYESELVSKIPSQPTPEEVATIAPEILRQSDESIALWKQTTKGDPKVYKVLKSVLNLTEDVDMVRFANAVKAARSLNGLSPEILNAMTKRLPDKKLLSRASLSLEKVALGKMSHAEFAAAHPEVSQNFRELLANVTDEMQRNSAELEALGVVQPGMTEARRQKWVDQYVAQQYAAYLNPKGVWAKALPSEAAEKAINFFVKQHEANGQLLTDAAAVKMLENFVNAEDPVSALRDYSANGKQVFSRLLKKEDLPPELKGALGASSGSFRVAYSLGQQRALLAQHRMWGELSSSPMHWSPGPRPDLPVQIPNEPNQFGRAAGGFTKAELAPLMDTAKTAADGFRWVNALKSMWKAGVTIKNPASWILNFLRNVPATIIVDPNVEHFVQAHKAFSAWMAEPVLKAGMPESLVNEARRVGALSSGMAANEITHHASQITDEMIGALKQGGGVPGMLKAWGAKALKLNQSIDKTLAHGYDYNDQFFKLANYIKLKESGLSDATSKGLIGPEANEHAARYAAEIVNALFPNFENLPTWADKFRKSALGAAAPFASSQLEELRIMAQLNKNARRFPVVNKGLYKLAAVTAGIYGANRVMREANGISQADVKAADATLSERGKYYHPEMMYLPIRDQHGRLQTLDLSKFIMPLQMMQGDTSDPLLARIVGNTLLSPLGQGLQDAGRSAANQAGLLRQGKTYSPLEGERGITATLMSSMAQSGFLPGGLAIPKAIDMIRRTGGEDNPAGYLGKFEEPFTPAQAGARYLFPMGNPVALPKPGSTTKSQAKSGLEFAGNVAEQTRQMKTAAMTRDPKDLKRDIEANVARIQELSKTYSGKQEIINQYLQQLGQGQK